MPAKVKVNIKFGAAIDELLSNKTQIEIGKKLKAEIIKITQSGLSPVRGQGRFVRYASQRGTIKAKADRKKDLNLVKTKRGAREVRAHYRNILAGQLNKYPNTVRKKFPDKGVTPVNLTLDGSMLNSMSVEKIPRGFRLIFDDGKRALMAMGHHYGNPKLGLPVRKVLPNNEGEEFIISITRLLKDLYSEALSVILKK